MSSIDILRNKLSDFLSIQGEWPEVCNQAKLLIQNILQQVQGVNFIYQGCDLLFDTSFVFDKDSLEILKLYRSIAASLQYSNNRKFNKLLPKIQQLVVSQEKLYLDTESNDAFIHALQKCRTIPNRIVCKYNDRGNKVSYFQTFEYDLKKITEVVSTFKTYNSAYKNYCLYIALNKMNNTEVMLLQTLRKVCEHQYDVFSDENECWAAAMSALRILDYHYLTQTDNNNLPNVTSITKLSLLLLNIYIKYHASKDRLRAMDCFANRARLNERFYKLGFFLIIISEYSSRLLTNSILTKHLCMFDLEQAKQLSPYELAGEVANNYNYFASQLMMYQNQGIGGVLPNNGDPFDSSFNEMIRIGKDISNEINSKVDKIAESIFEEFIVTYASIEQNLRNIVNSYYKNKRKYSELTNCYCLSWNYQLESYAKFGRIKADFLPVKYHINTFLKIVDINIEQIEQPKKCQDGYVYQIKDFNRSPIMLKNISTSFPFIRILSILTDNDGNMKAFNCYGQDFKEWIRELRWYHTFFGVAVSPFGEDLTHGLETVLLTVRFQAENDLNI